MTGVCRFLRGTLPVVVAIVVAPPQVVHRKMVAAKEWYEDTVATRLSTLEAHGHVQYRGVRDIACMHLV